MAPDPDTMRGVGRPRPDSQARPRVLVLAESLPWPPLKGGDLRTWQNLNALVPDADVGIFGLCSNDRRRAGVPRLPLAFWTTSSDPALTAPPPKGVRLAGRAWLFEPRGHPSDLFHSPGAAAELERLLADFRPEAVIVEGLWLHRYLDVIRAAGCKVILDCHNIEATLFRELARTRAGEDFESRVIRDVVPARTELIERAAVSVVDQLWVCSDDDAAALRELYHPAAPVVVIPNGVCVADYTAVAGWREVNAPAAALTMLFPGIFSYPPNAYAAAFLADELLPRLAAEADVPCRLQLVGPMPTAEMRAAAARDTRVAVTGAVPDVRPYLTEATVLAVPLRHGSGTRLKVLEAFAAGLPVVSTAKGVEGLGAADGVHVLVAETAAEFVAGVLAVSRDMSLARGLASAARALVLERYSWEAVGPRIRHALEQLLAVEVPA